MLDGIGFVRFIRIKFKLHHVEGKPSLGGPGQADGEWRAGPSISIENIVLYWRHQKWEYLSTWTTDDSRRKCPRLQYDLAIDEAVCRLGALLAGLNKFGQDHWFVHCEFKPGLTEALSAFMCEKAARTRYRAVYQAGVAAMLGSGRAERQGVAAVVSVRNGTLCCLAGLWGAVEIIHTVRVPKEKGVKKSSGKRRKQLKDGGMQRRQQRRRQQ